MRKHASFIALLTVGFLSTGCLYYGGSNARYVVTNETSTNDVKKTPEGYTNSIEYTAEKSCEIRLYAEQKTEDLGQIGVGRIKDERIGAALVEKVKDKNNSGEIKLVDGVCIKYENEPIQFPSAALIAGVGWEEEGWWEWITRRNTTRLQKLFCNGKVEDKKYHYANCPSGTCGKAEVCKWNGQFNATQPFTFTFVTKPDVDIKKYIRIVRVFRNGELIGAWDQQSYQPENRINEIEFRGGDLIPPSQLNATVVPHLSDMDIRIIPTESELNNNEISMIIHSPKKFKDVVLPAGNEALRAIDEEYEGDLTCFAQKLKNTQMELRNLVTGNSNSVSASKDTCAPLISVEEKQTFSQKYSMLKSATVAEANRWKQETIDSLSELPKKIEDLGESEKGLVLGQVYTKLSADVKSVLSSEQSLWDFISGNLEIPPEKFEPVKAEIEKYKKEFAYFLKYAKYIDEQITATLSTVDDTKYLVDTLYDLSLDKSKQAIAFSAFVNELDKQGGPFEPRQKNPPLLKDERQLRMEYGDRLQMFFLAPWFAVPLRVTDEMGADFNAAVALPFLDVVGTRWQWGKSRFSEFRTGLGFGYSMSKNEDDNTSMHTGVATFCLSLGNLRVGWGVVLRSEDNINWRERQRIMIGADLFKIITGKDVEGF